MKNVELFAMDVINLLTKINLKILMALDFFILENDNYLFGLESEKYYQLEEIFDIYKHPSP